MKKIFFLFLLCALHASIYAQSRASLSGQLISKTSSQPLYYATVALYTTTPHEIVGGTVTDSLGRFRLDKIKYGRYEIKCSYVGCKDYISKQFAINANNQNINLGKIIIDDSGQALNEVVVNGKRSTYVQTVDKKIFNVGSDIASGSGAVSDLLQNVPSVQVDIEGNVSLRGNDNVLVLINGKPSVLMRGANRGTILQQIPASSIERIEVITNPSAQFKPDGTSGIINLILKKDRATGLNGNVLANVGNKGRYNGGLALGWNSPKFGVNLNYGFRKDRRDRTNKNDRTLTDEATGLQTNLLQNSVTKAPSKSHIGGISLQWNPTKKDAFEASGNYTNMKFPRTEDNVTVQRSNQVIEKEYDRHRFDNEIQQEAEGMAAYTHTFGKDHSITADYTYSLQDETENNHYSNIYTLPTSITSYDNTLIKQNNYSNLARLQYSNKINERNSLVAGYEGELDKSVMYYFAEDLIDGSWVKNTDKSNDFIFNENIHAFYTTWEHSLGNFALMLGARGELSFIKSNLRTLNQIVHNNYFLFFPTFHSSYKINDQNELQFNYSLRVHRPEGDDLNPFPEYQDPYNLRAGNPYLKPEKIHSLEIGWQFKKDATTMIMTPYYRYTYDKMTSITKVLDGGVVKTTSENMSSSKAAGTELIVNSAIGKWCNFNFSSNVFYNTIDASDLGYSNKKGSLAWYLSLNSDFYAFKNFMLQVNTRYNSSVLTPQGKKEGTYIMNMGAKYDIPKWKLTITATVSDLFNSYKNVMLVNIPTINQRVERRRSPRLFYIGLSYKFGGHSNSKKDKELKYDESL